MAWRVAMVVVGLLLAAGAAWALSEGDSGVVWIQAPFQQKVQVTNVLSREFGADPSKLQQCLDKTFAQPANAGKTIREAAQQCTKQQP